MRDDKAQAEPFVLTSSRGFAAWLDRSGSSIAFTTYQAGKIFVLGVKGDGQLSVFERNFARSMGLAVSNGGRTLALATQVQIHRLNNILPPGCSSADGYDAIYTPQASWVTGDVDAHDVGFDKEGRPIFANTLFSCVAAISDSHSFRPIWKPPFISKLAPEDRCHLNGLAIEDGQLSYVTAVSRSDVADGWRDRRSGGGVVMDVTSNEVVADGLSMPHSPRLHEGRLWLLNSGTGQLGFIDIKVGKFEPVTFCPGYARGLAFTGKHAIVGLSLARENRTFAGLPLDDSLRERDTEPRCGLAVVDLETGNMAHWVRIDGVVRELYDVAVLPGVRRPSLVGFKSDEIRFMLSIEES